MKNIKWNFIEYIFVRAIMAFINFFPITIATWIARRVGDILFLALAGRRKTAIGNLNIAFGSTKSNREKIRIALESFRNLTTSFMEFFRLPKFIKISEKHIRFQGAEHMDHAFARGKGFILAMCHLGPWEYMGLISYQKKYHTAILGRPIKNPYFYEWIKSLRRMMGLYYIDKDTGPKAIFSRLKKNYGVGIAIDQWAGNYGLWIDFFGRPTSTTAIPAEFAKRTNCALIPAYFVRVSSGEYEMHIEPEILPDKSDKNWVENATKKLNHLLEEKIRAYPEQWMWTHKRWKNKRHVI
ncbi:MAG: lysophospholipid acyltransferase family protein [Omnitrophica bacterium]|nr:lysophospholipid acyltransferase family protein [Candidatus Omnitrophota bacterium]